MTTDTIHIAPDKFGFLAGYIERSLRGSQQPPRACMSGAYSTFRYNYPGEQPVGAKWRAYRNSFFAALRGQVPS